MEIRINTVESGPDELTALIALCASLGGRLPVSNVVINTSITAEDRRVAEHADVNQGRRGPPLGVAADETPPPPADASPVDSAGIPWDERIHSSSKERNKSDDTWRKRRGVDDATFAAVMAELTAAGNGAGTADDQSATGAAASPPASNDEAPPPPPADEPEGNEPDVPAPPAPTEDKPSDPEPAANAPAAGDPPTPAGGGQFPDFASFVGAVSKHSIPYAELNERAATLGVPMFKDLKDHADKWDLFFSMIG